MKLGLSCTIGVCYTFHMTIGERYSPWTPAGIQWKWRWVELKRIYLDNAATSYPKAPGVGSTVQHFIDDIGANIQRSGYASAQSSEELVFETREKLARFFNFEQSENVVFTLNITQSLNFILKGLLQPGDHVIVSSLEHNAVMRPLTQLSQKGVGFSRAACNQDGQLDLADLVEKIKPNTKMVVLTHASNVSGSILPAADVGKICRERGLLFVLDTAQTAGVLDLDFEQLGLDVLAFTGHKGLLGPQGIGGFLIRDEVAEKMEPLISGGTGSLSEYEEVPPYLPDKFEAGTLNLPGICGLGTALDYLLHVGVAWIRERERELTKLLLEGFSVLKGAQIAGPLSLENRVAVVSVDFPGRDNAEVAYHLDKYYGIRTRCGLHCSPAAHKTLGTFPRGTVRFSPGHLTTKAEIEHTLTAVSRTLAELPYTPK